MSKSLKWSGGFTATISEKEAGDWWFELYHQGERITGGGSHPTEYWAERAAITALKEYLGGTTTISQ